MSALKPMSRAELSGLLRSLQAAPGGVVTFELAWGEALWLINAGLSEARRAEPPSGPTPGTTRRDIGPLADD